VVDNVFVERLWLSLKYEEVHLKAYANGLGPRIGIGQWIRFYNGERDCWDKLCHHAAEKK
jgi:putative transposase